MIRRIGLLFVLAGFAVAATASSAGAAVTIGSNLGRAPGGAPDSFGCTPPCTFAQATLDGDRQAAGGIVSPVNGTVTLWRIRAAGASSPTALRVITPLSGALFTGAGTSATETPALNTTSTYPTQLPIAIGDRIGIDCCQPPAQYFLTSGGTIYRWQPPLAEGGPGTASAFPLVDEIALNADIEPISTFTLGAITRNKKKGSATLKVNVPNPGDLTGSGNGANVASTGTAVISKSVGAGQAQLVIKAKGKKKQKLNREGKVKVNVAVTYTPTGGDPNTQSVKVKLKKKLKR